MKKYFSAGLAILLPIFLTLAILIFLINFFTAPFLKPTKNMLEQFLIFQHSPLIEQSTLLDFMSKGLIVFFLCGIVMLVGLFGKVFFIDLFFRFSNSFFQRVPYINRIYKTCHDVVHCLFSSSSKSFQQVVFVPFPNKKNLILGLVTCDPLTVESFKQKRENLISVFVPGTPNPSTGFLLLLKKERLLFSNMKVEEAMKFVLSFGIVMPKSKIQQNNEMNEHEFHY